MSKASNMCQKPKIVENPRYPIAHAVEEVEKALKDSTFLQSVKVARDEYNDETKYRALTYHEVAQLERQGCGAENWGTVLVTSDFKPKRVRNCEFHGRIRLGCFTGRINVGSSTLPTGVFSSDLNNVTIGNNSLVSRCVLLNNCAVGEGVCILGCGELSCTGTTAFGMGEELPIAIETGGRETRTYAEITVAVAAGVASNRHDIEMLARYNAAVSKYVELSKCEICIFADGCRVLSTPKIKNSYIGHNAVVDGATWIENTTMLSEDGEISKVSAGAVVKHSILQWGSEVDTFGLSQNSVLCEHSHVERHGMLSDSLLGPNSGVAEGEITASLCGPFVGFHHQSLLIAAFWPEGKGNVGYGANVGSNHTSKAPDQELWPGEGTFFGLGSCVKFPADFSSGIYSIFASGVTTLPQRMAVPFSLINTPAETIPGLSPAYNEIFPGWVLSDNIYTINRNEGKYKKRNKAKRSTFNFNVFRPDTINLMMKARKLLEDAVGSARVRNSKGQPVYTDREISILGKNYCTEGALKNGVHAFTFYAQYYALQGLKEQFVLGATLEDVLDRESEDEVWIHQRGIIESESDLQSLDVIQMLERLSAMRQAIDDDVRQSKEKDDIRGKKIIPDYEHAHIPAIEDGFVVETAEKTKRDREEIAKLFGPTDSFTRVYVKSTRITLPDI
eukprot:CFRG5561T1